MLGASLGRFYAVRGASKAARDLLQKAYTVIRSGDHQEEQAWIEPLYAEQLIESGAAAEAELICARLLHRARRHWGAEHPASAAASVMYLRALLANGELELAEQWAKECRQRWEQGAGGSLRRKVASIRGLLAAAYVARGRAAEAHLEAENALYILADFAFEGQPERLRAMLCLAHAELQMGKLDPEPPLYRGAEVLAGDVLRELARTWGLAHPHATEAAGLISDTVRARSGDEEADAFLSAFHELADGFPDLGEAGHRPPEEMIRRNREFLKFRLDLPSMEDIEENITQATRREFGPTFLDTLGRAPQLRSVACAALERHDIELGLEIILELTRHYVRTLGPESPEYIEALSDMAAVLEAARDHPWARAVRERIFEHWLEREGDRHPNTIRSALYLIILMCNAGDTRLAKLEFDRHVLLPLQDAPVAVSEPLQDDLPLIRKLEAVFAQFEQR
jgi:hypothetical protein